MTRALTSVQRNASPRSCSSAATKNLLLLLLLCVAPVAAQAQYSMPFNHYLAALKSREGDPRVAAFARSCIGREAPKAKRVFLYTEGADWIKTPDLPETFAGYQTGDANTAEVWMVNGVPRAVYLWEVDLEYQRDSLFCLAANGDDITHDLSRFFPSESGEPREHWIYFHSVKTGPRVNVWISNEWYEDARGKRLDHPELSAEDKDFIKGERVYHYWNDFDFSQKVAPDKTQPKISKLLTPAKASDAAMQESAVLWPNVERKGSN